MNHHLCHRCEKNGLPSDGQPCPVCKHAAPTCEGCGRTLRAIDNVPATFMRAGDAWCDPCLTLRAPSRSTGEAPDLVGSIRVEPR